jgi:hypothetical protein
LGDVSERDWMEERGEESAEVGWRGVWGSDDVGCVIMYMR